MGGIVPLIVGHIPIFQEAFSCLHIVIRAIRATMLGAF